MEHVKRRSTYYTEAKVRAARTNVLKYGWAAAARDKAVAYAERIVEKGMDYVWELVPSQQLPRSYQTNQILGNLSPLSDAPPSDNPLNKLGNYPWKADPLSVPWKLTDPTSGYSFPTNDFGAYYRSGLDAKGEFDPGLADRTLLVNTLYPEKGEQWGVDDGFGWVDPASGYRYTFIAYYTHWFLWFGAEAIILRSLIALRDAYLFTGEAKYARFGAVLLDRLADIYPTMDVSRHDAEVYLNSHGGSGRGKTVGCIWETSTAKTLVSAYDAFFPALDDAELIRFLQQKSERYGLSPKFSASLIAANMENGLLRETYEGFRAADIRGNNGFHQSALAFAAVVLDSDPETKLWLDYTFQAGGYERNPDRLTGGNVWNTLVNDVDRDGHGDEAAPGYNRLWLSTYLQVADVLEGYDRYPDADLYEHVKFRKMFHSVYPVTMLGRDTAQIGDTGKTGNPGTLLHLEESVLAFRKYGDPVFAQIAYTLNGNSATGLHSSIFTDDPERIAADIEQAVALHGRFELGGTNLTGYGFAALRDGEAAAGTLRDVWLYYGRNGGHGHRDTLNIGLHAYGLDLLPDLGYPEQANAMDRHRKEWVLNVISHNTVLVDREKTKLHVVGRPQHYDSGGLVQLIDVEAPHVYPQTEQYRRTTAMIRVDAERFYAVDLFRVRGGTEHHYSFHSAEGTVATEGLTLEAQSGGTYAGPDIAFGVKPEWDGDNAPAAEYNGSGFHWLRNVERAIGPEGPFSVDWNVRDTWDVYGRGAGADTDVHLRLTMLNAVDEVAFADGVPPRNKLGNPAELRYMIAHRDGRGKPLDSLFVSVLEPYRGDRHIRSIEAVSVTMDGMPVPEQEARAIRVQLANGRTDYIVYARNQEAGYMVDGRIAFSGFFGLYAEQDGRVVHRYVHDGTVIGPAHDSRAAGPGRLEGAVVDFTKEMSTGNYVDVRFDTTVTSLEPLQRAMIYIEHAENRNAVYTIRGAEALDDAGTYRLDLGDVTLIHRYKNNADPAEGYVYDVAAGAKFYIPLSPSLASV